MPSSFPHRVDPAEAGAGNARRRWWQRPGTTDAVDVRGITMLRRLLVLVAVCQLGMLLWQGAQMGWMTRSLGIGGLLACAASLLLLRRRQLQLAAAVFVLAHLLLLSVAYGYMGLRAQSQSLLLQLLPILLAGVLLGRKALWVATVWLCGLLAHGAWQDAAGGFYHPARVQGALMDLALAGVGVLMAAFVLDQAMASLRQSLRTVQRRSAELARKRDKLQLEMQEKERSREQLVHAMKIENVGRLASGVAHDFNHLLALIMGYAGKGRRSDDPAELKVALQGVESAAKRATAVTRRLLDFSRQEVARPQLLDAAQVIGGMEPMLRQLFGADVAFELDTGGVRCQIHFDPAQLELILLSLAANAEQAMPDGGRFQLRLSHSDTRAELHVEVRDSGQGMNEEVRRRCLEPFFTTKPSGQGTGLGLAVTANLIEAGGGRVTVESEPGRGSCFHLWLPARPLPA